MPGPTHANNVLPLHNGMPPLSPSKRMRSNSSSNLLQEDFGSAMMAGALNNPYTQPGHVNLAPAIAPSKQPLLSQHSSASPPSSLLLNAVAAPPLPYYGQQQAPSADLIAAQQAAAASMMRAAHPSPASVPSSSDGGFAADLSKALKSVVKVFCTAACPNYSTPWQMHAQSKSTASGFVVAPASRRQILTNAHAVANQVQVSLRKHGNARKFPARVLAVGHECDLALLTVEDDEFWEGTEALEVCEGLPAMQESVTVVGFPQGGDNVCVTKGVVSRIDRQQYSHGRTSLLAVQIDAAINSGNSGGPVLLDGRVVGIAFQCLTAGENIGYIIPVPVVRHFLNDLTLHEGRYTGFCELGTCWMSLESPDMRASLGLPSALSGIYLTHVEPLYNAAQVLRVGDVLTHFNGHAIADDGTFSCPSAGAVRIDFRHLVAMNYEGDTAMVRVWRQGVGHMELPVKVHVPKQLVPVHSHDVRPSYYIYGGLVFVALSNFYLRSTYGTDWAHKAPIKLCDRTFAGEQEIESQEVVVLAKVLASDANIGYQDLGNVQVCRVNGHKVHSLAHLAHLLEGLQDGSGNGAASGRGFVRFELEWHKVVVLDHGKATRCEQGILQQNCIPARCSPELLARPLPANLPGMSSQAPAPSPLRMALPLSPPASPLTPATPPDFNADTGVEAEAVIGRMGVQPDSLFSPSAAPANAAAVPASPRGVIGMLGGAVPKSPKLRVQPPARDPVNGDGADGAEADDDADEVASMSSQASSAVFSTATNSKRVAGAGPNLQGEEVDSPAKGPELEADGGMGGSTGIMLQGEAVQKALSPSGKSKSPGLSPSSKRRLQQQYNAEIDAAAEGISKL